MNASKHGPPSLFGVYGAGGCGRGVLPVADAMLKARYDVNDYELVFIDDGCREATINGRQVLSLDSFAAKEASSRAVSIAIADASVREKLAGICRDRGIRFFTVAAPECVIMDDVELGEGAILSPYVALTSNIRIGRHFHANLYACVEHDCRIGDFVTFAPGVRCNGNVVIGDRAYLGAGCIIRQGKPGAPLEIGAGAIIGMGAVVTKSVPPGVTVAGNPARAL